MNNFSLFTHRYPTTDKKPRSLVVLLHGYGADGQDLIGLAPFWSDDMPDTLFLAPDAPSPHEGGMGRQWFSLTQGLELPSIAALLDLSASLIHDYLDELLEHYELQDDALLLGGFSQGAMLALHVGLRRSKPLPLAGIMSFSGLLATEPPPPKKSQPPILLTHGRQDPLIPPACLHHADQILQKHGISTKTHLQDNLAHGIDESIVAIAKNFIKEQFSS